jgi:hypothetical protein
MIGSIILAAVAGVFIWYVFYKNNDDDDWPGYI